MVGFHSIFCDIFSGTDVIQVAKSVKGFTDPGLAVLPMQRKCVLSRAGRISSTRTSPNKRIGLLILGMDGRRMSSVMTLI